MEKICPSHGKTVSMVERDKMFYLQCMESAANTIYSGYFIDVTHRCNLKCKYCYYPVSNKTKDRTITDLTADAFLHKSLAPFILTGGEPSLREDLVDVVKALRPFGPVELLTNATGLNKQNMKELLPLLSNGFDIYNINVSYHPEIAEDLERFFSLCREMKVRLESVLFVIDDLKDIDKIYKICCEWKDVIIATRIKAATQVWAEQKPKNKIFVSDILHYMEDAGAEMVWWRKNKVSFVTTELDEQYHMLVSWYDRFNVDMLDINCAPYYQAKTGETLNILTAMLVNEGIERGWLNGNKIEGERPCQ